MRGKKMNRELYLLDLQAELCQSLSNATRLRIIQILKESPKSVGDISAELNMAQPTVSRHLAVLRASGLLTANRKAQEVFYEIANPKVVVVCEMMRSILAEREVQHSNLLHYIQTEDARYITHEIPLAGHPQIIP
jgi:ArsR family transcriptional regulator